MTNLDPSPGPPRSPGGSPPPPSAAAGGGHPAVSWDRVDRFLGQFTHDVRNGLNALELQLTLLGEISQEADVREEVRGLRTNVAAIGRDLQAVRAATAPVLPQRVPYGVADLLEDLRPRLHRRHAKPAEALDWQVSPELAEATVETDPELLFDALGRVFDNAVCFRATPSAPLGFRAARAADGEGNPMLRLTFIEEEKTAPALTDLSAWGDQPFLSTRRGAHAYGLGLFRARRIAEAHDGDLHAHYDAAARRLEVSLDLPLPAAPGRDHAGDDAADLRSDR